MEIRTNAGILYPENPQPEVVHSNKPVSLPCQIQVPHKSWEFIENELISAFSSVSEAKPGYVFVFAPLHKGKVRFDDSFRIYTYSDCTVQHELLEKNDTVCSEEYSYEILLPFIRAYFPGAVSTAFFAPEADSECGDFKKYILEKYPDSILIVSSNESGCGDMWL